MYTTPKAISLFCFFFLFLIQSTNSQINILNRKVKSLVTITYEAKERSGRIIKIKQIDKWIEKYNIDGNMYEEISNSFFAPDRAIYYYDESGRMIKKAYKYLKGDYFIITYQYDTIGRLAEEINYGQDGNIQYRKSYLYDERGKKSNEFIYNIYGDCLNTFHYEYDEEGKLMERNGHNYEWDNASKVTYVFDEKGNKLEEKWYASSPKVNNGAYELYQTYKFKYDENNNEIEWILDQIDIVFKENFEYQKYDSQGNWLNRIGYHIDNHNKTFIEICDRKIKYY